MWSIKLQKIFVVLQAGSSISENLLEAFLQIRDDATCIDIYSDFFTDNMICAGSHYGYIGPCNVRSYNTNKFVCEIFIFHSNTKI